MNSSPAGRGGSRARGESPARAGDLACRSHDRPAGIPTLGGSTMSQPLSEHRNPAAPGGSARATGAAPPAQGGSSPTYPMILRHLARLRDGALAVLDLLEPHRPVGTVADTPPASPTQE